MACALLPFPDANMISEYITTIEAGRKNIKPRLFRHYYLIFVLEE